MIFYVSTTDQFKEPILSTAALFAENSVGMMPVTVIRQMLQRNYGSGRKREIRVTLMLIIPSERGQESRKVFWQIS